MRILRKIPNKIKNLNIINKVVSVPKYYYFDYLAFYKKSLQFLKKINTKFKKKIIIRSAFYEEDGIKTNVANIYQFQMLIQKIIIKLLKV